MPDQRCEICGAPIMESDKECYNCGEPNQAYTTPLTKEKIKDLLLKYDIDEAALMQNIKSKEYLDIIDDNCIIYKNGMIDAYDKPEQLFEALSGEYDEFNTLMSEMHEDIYLILLEGKKATFKIYNQVNFYVGNSIVQAEDVLFDKQIKGAKCLITCKDIPRTVFRFDSPMELAQWINKADESVRENIAMVFIDRVFHEFEVIKKIKVNDREVEISAPIVYY